MNKLYEKNAVRPSLTMVLELEDLSKCCYQRHRHFGQFCAGGYFRSVIALEKNESIFLKKSKKKYYWNRGRNIWNPDYCKMFEELSLLKVSSFPLILKIKQKKKKQTVFQTGWESKR